MHSLKLLNEQLSLLGIAEVENAKIADTNLLVESRQGALTAQIEGRWLHSKHDPIKEAQRQCDQLKVDNQNQLLVLFGNGLGYVLEEILQRFANPVVLVEPRADILTLLLGLKDFRKQLQGDRLQILSGAIEEEDWQAIARGRQNADILFISHRASYQLDSVYANLQISLETFLNKKSVNLATLSRFDRLWARNLIRNFSMLSQARPVQRLFGIIPNASAILCGAGPSLSYDIKKLKEHRTGRVLIAVDTALHILNANGIEPDLVFSVDPQGLNQYYLEGYNGNAYVVIDPTATYLSLRHIPVERLFFMNSPFALMSLLSDCAREEIGEVAFGGSVSTNAYDLAIQMGCKEILIYGQDLSFPGSRAHAAGALLEERLNYKENRLFRRERHNYNQLSALPEKYLEAIHKEMVQTNDKLIIFMRWFENRFALDQQAGLKIIDCKSVGARFNVLEENEPSTFGDPQIAWLNMQSDPEMIVWPRPPSSAALQLDCDAFMESLESSVADFSWLQGIAGQALQVARNCLSAIRKNQKDDQYFARLRELDSLDQKLQSRQSSMRIVGGAIQNIIFQLTEGFQSQLSAEEKSDPHLKSAREAELLYEGIARAAQDHCSWLNKSLHQLKKMQAD